MKMTGRKAHYRIFLLTIWSEQSQASEATPMWRFSLENPRNGERHGFSNLAALITALHQEIANAQSTLDIGGEDES